MELRRLNTKSNLAEIAGVHVCDICMYDSVASVKTIILC